MYFNITYRKSQVKLVHLKLYKVRSFFLSFQTAYKNIFFASFCLFPVIFIPLNLSAFTCSISVLCVLLLKSPSLTTKIKKL